MIVLAFILFGGADIVGWIITQHADVPVALINRWSATEWYSGIMNLQYSSNTTLLYWVPQHALAGWLTAALLINHLLQKRDLAKIGLVFSVSLLWSPLVTIGLLPFLVVMLFAERKRILRIISLDNFLAFLAIALPLILYFVGGSSDQGAGIFLSYTPPDGAALAGPTSLTSKLLFVILFILLEFALLSALIQRQVIRNENTIWICIFVASTVFLALLPLLRYGIFNDLAMRGSIPCLFALFILIMRTLQTQPKTSELFANYCVVALLALGSITALVEFNTHVVSKKLTLTEQHMEVWGSIGNRQLSEDEKRFTAQYIGDPDSAFYRYIAR